MSKLHRVVTERKRGIQVEGLARESHGNVPHQPVWGSLNSAAEVGSIEREREKPAPGMRLKSR